MPDDVYDVEVELDACAYAFAAGQRMRVSVAGADWPNTASPPEPVRLTIHGGELQLPLWSGPSPYADPILAPGGSSGEDAAGVTWVVERDVLARTTSCRVDHGSAYALPYDGTATEHYEGRITVDQVTFKQDTAASTTFTLRWSDVEVSTTATMNVTISAETLDVTIELAAWEATGDVGSTLASRRWDARLPRRA